MSKEYKDKEKRKQYLVDYRNRNREKLRKDSKEYYKKIGTENWRKKYYKYNHIHKKRNNGELVGTSGLGRKYEKIALKLLSGSKDCNTNSFAGKWDIEWNRLRIDVKMRNKNKRGVWGFTTKKNPVADYYLCFCVEDNNIKKVYLIPKEVFKTSLTITRKNSALDRYIVL